MALTTVTVHGEILAPVTNTPAVGTVVFDTLIELRDVVDNVVYVPMRFTATLDAGGEFTIVLPATDNPDLVPSSWVYQVWINTDTLNTVQYFQIPFAPGVTEFADLTPLDYDPCSGLPALTPVPAEESALFVRKTGDTMTGNLIINANLQVSGSASASYEGVQGDIMRLISTALSTGVTSGGEFTPNADPTKVDISATTGWIVDYNSTGIIGPANPMITYISIPAQIGITPTVGVPTGVTWYLVDTAGTLTQQATVPTPEQRRTHLVLGATAQAGGVVVVDQTLPVIQSQPANQLVDLMEALGGFRMNGGRVTPNGVNLNMNVAAGTLFVRAFSQVPDYQNPHHSHINAQTPIQYRRITALAGSAGALVNALDVGNYDPAGSGVVTPVGGGANRATNFRIWAFGSNSTADQILIQYGQTAYNTLADAVAAIGTTSYIVNPTAAGSGVLLGWISAIRTATNLSDPLQAVFTSPAGKFATP